MPVDRSPELVKVVYFLNEYARRDGNRERPPQEFHTLNWREVYELFFDKLGDGRSFKTFMGSSQSLRRGNIRDHKDHSIEFYSEYERTLRLWVSKPREEQFEEIGRWITLPLEVQR